MKPDSFRCCTSSDSIGQCRLTLDTDSVGRHPPSWPMRSQTPEKIFHYKFNSQNEPDENTMPDNDPEWLEADDTEVREARDEEET
uniref:Uncharacterized protein n=1 Tax=Romanomermis culicivorax TaxID=13658 RepID=A0A915ICQ6_ROMCU